MTLPFAERVRQSCLAWATQGYGTPTVGYLFYILKLGLFFGLWVVSCAFSPALGSLSEIGQWWLHPIAFQKAMVGTMLFEVLGLGCGSGPLTGRYMPPIGGFLYFLRPGTTKLPLFPKLPIVGGMSRSWIDVGLYLGLLASLIAVLLHPAPGLEQYFPIIIVTGVLLLCDKTIFLAARSEHYWVLCICFAFAGNWISGAKAVWLALWFWAGFSKLNHHFSAVVGVMTSNSPVIRFGWFRRAVYRDFPNDLRPSRLAGILGHIGTALEFTVPLCLALGSGGTLTTVGLIGMVLLHGYITSNIPMGVPIEWNFVMVYGGLFLFGVHADVSIFDLGAPAVAAFLLGMLVVLPLFGNLFPERASFLTSMRYYAGNWAYSVWLFRGESYRKLDAHIKKSTPWVGDQLDRFYDRETAEVLLGKVIAFRLMHLHGRALQSIVPLAVDNIEEYAWVDGEIVAGAILGWNFGDGHLHDERLLTAVQAQCQFAPGELRCIFVESQPVGRPRLRYRVADACTGPIAVGDVSISELRQRQPWPSIGQAPVV